MFGWIPRLLAWIALERTDRRAHVRTAPPRNAETLLLIEQQMQQWR